MLFSLTTQIDSLPLSIRVRHALYRAQIYTLGQLIEERGRGIRIYGIGEGGKAEIEQLLKGIELRSGRGVDIHINIYASELRVMRAPQMKALSRAIKRMVQYLEEGEAKDKVRRIG